MGGLRKYTYIVASFLAGFSLMTFELIAARLAAPIIGSSVYTWTSVIGTVLLGLSFGSIVGGALADRYKNDILLGLTFFLSALAVSITPFLAHFVHFSYASFGVWASALFVSLALFLVPSILLGLLEPMILKLYARDFTSLGASYGILSAVWSVGSIAGVFLTGFYFIATIGSTAVLIGIGFLLFLSACYFLTLEKHTLVKRIFLMVIGAVLFLFLFTVVDSHPAGASVVYEKETSYYLARVVNANNLLGLGPAKVLFLDFDSHSIEKEKEDGDPLFYTAMAPVFGVLNKHINNIHVIGGGAYTLPKHLADRYPSAHISVTEIDPEVTRIAEDYFGLKKYDIASFAEDARSYFAHSSEMYDLVFGDAYNSFISVPWHLTTREFTKQVRDHLTDGGIYAVNFISSLNSDKQEFFISMLKTFSTIFPNHYIFVFGENEHGVQNIVLVGVNDDSPRTTEELFTLLKKNNETKQFASLLVRDNFDVSSGVTLTDDFAPVESLMGSAMRDYFPRYVAFYNSLVR